LDQPVQHPFARNREIALSVKISGIARLDQSNWEKATEAEGRDRRTLKRIFDWDVK
jgi:hypothetical protein